VTAYALTLRPVYVEIARVLRPGGALVLQTKDLRFGDFLVPLASVHRDLVEDTGLGLVTRVLWQKFRSRRAPSEAFRRRQAVGNFRTDDLDEFLVFAHPEGIATRRARVDLPDDELAACAAPVWRYPPLGRNRGHPFQSPPGLVRRFVALYSAPGDLIVDPFTGHGTTLRAAVELGRRAVGYELSQHYAAAADRYVAGALPPLGVSKP
jgi:site-specific DNA-methyltransferase (adenine-specific)